jgi:hypothetical protein
MGLTGIHIENKLKTDFFFSNETKGILGVAVEHFPSLHLEDPSKRFLNIERNRAPAERLGQQSGFNRGVCIITEQRER